MQVKIQAIWWMHASAWLSLTFFSITPRQYQQLTAPRRLFGSKDTKVTRLGKPASAGRQGWGAKHRRDHRPPSVGCPLHADSRERAWDVPKLRGEGHLLLVSKWHLECVLDKDTCRTASELFASSPPPSLFSRIRVFISVWGCRDSRLLQWWGNKLLQWLGQSC